LGGPNFHQIPINAPLAQTHNNQRDGFHQHQIHRGRVNYEPNSLAGGCPFQAGAAGFQSFAEKLAQTSREAEPTKLRAKPHKFAEHYAQARLFLRSQTGFERQHIIDAFRFELTRVQTQAIRERVVAQLRNVDETLALAIAQGLGMESLPASLPLLTPVPEGEVQVSPGLSLLARPGDGSVRTRRIALLVADGMDTAASAQLYEALSAAGALPRYVGARLGRVRGSDGSVLPVEVSFEAMPAVLWDALVLPSGEDAADLLALDDQVMEFVTLHWRHDKVMLVPHSAAVVLEAAGIQFDGSPDFDEVDEVDEFDESLAEQPLSETDVDLAADDLIMADDGEIEYRDAGVLLVVDEDYADAAEQFIILLSQHRAYGRFDGNAMLPVGVEPAAAPASALALDRDDTR
jgi:catalase